MESVLGRRSGPKKPVKPACADIFHVQNFNRAIHLLVTREYTFIVYKHLVQTSVRKLRFWIVSFISESERTPIY